MRDSPSPFEVLEAGHDTHLTSSESGQTHQKQASLPAHSDSSSLRFLHKSFGSETEHQQFPLLSPLSVSITAQAPVLWLQVVP